MQEHWGKKGNFDEETLKVMVIGAHPDDCDFYAGCTAAKLARIGARVHFVSLANGDRGHQTMMPEELAARRKLEAQAAAKAFGIEEYLVLNNHDCYLEPSIELRMTVTNIIRQFAPDIIITHRTCDYHADHRATGRVVLDASYLIGVPHWCPETPITPRPPCIMYMSDRFTDPRAIRPDVMVDIDAYMDYYFNATSCHVSQVFEWMPYDMGILDEVPDPKDTAAVRAFITKYWGWEKSHDAERFTDAWHSQFPSRPVPHNLEVFEISEYGRRPTDRELKLLTD